MAVKINNIFQWLNLDFLCFAQCVAIVFFVGIIDATHIMYSIDVVVFRNGYFGNGDLLNIANISSIYNE